MVCNPRIVSLHGIQSLDGTIEDGNHLRAFVGIDDGAPEYLTFYRRANNFQEARIDNFSIPINKAELLKEDAILNGFGFDVTIETEQFLLALPATINTNGDRLSYSIKFSELVGYVNINFVRNPFSFINWFSSIIDKYRNANVFSRSKSTGIFLRSRKKLGLKQSRQFNLVTQVSHP